MHEYQAWSSAKLSLVSTSLLLILVQSLFPPTKIQLKDLAKRISPSVCSPRCLSRVDLLHHLRKLWMSSRKLPKHYRHMKSKKAEGYRSRDKNNRFWILWDWELRHICERQHGSQSLHDLFSCHRPSEQLISHKYLPSSPMLQYALTEGNCC